MQLGVIGVSHHGTALEQRECVIKIFREIETNDECKERFLGKAASFVLLITCHRVELYYHIEFASSYSKARIQELLDLMYCKTQARPYHYENEACFAHLFSVTGGADSLELGETEIQGQVKRAYLQSHQRDTLSFAMHFLFQKALKEGKTIRSQQDQSTAHYSLVEVVKDLLDQNNKTTTSHLLFIGYSEINRKMANRLQEQGFHKITFCSRTPHQVPYPCILRRNLSLQSHFDILFFGSSDLLCDLPFLSLASFCTKHRKKIIFDFNVPRVFKEHVSSPSLQLFDMDALSQYLHAHVKQSASRSVTQMMRKSLFERAAYKQWIIFMKKCAQNKNFVSQALVTCS